MKGPSKLRTHAADLIQEANVVQRAAQKLAAVCIWSQLLSNAHPRVRQPVHMHWQASGLFFTLQYLKAAAEACNKLPGASCRLAQLQLCCSAPAKPWQMSLTF